MVPALLFDLDGCLVDSLPSIRHCWQQTLPRFGAALPTDADVRRLAGPPVDAVARALLPSADEDTIAELVAAYRRCSVADVDRVSVYPGVPSLLDTLTAREITLAIATSKSIEVAEPVLDALGLRERFPIVEGTRRDEAGTDKATIVGRALASLARAGEVDPLGLVGDREHDVVGAHAHGIPAFGALWGYGSRAELSAAGADVLLETAKDLLARLP